MRLNGNSGARLLGGMLAFAVITTLGACKGENLFTFEGRPGTDPTDPGGGINSDAPVVDITIPRGDESSAKPLGDSIFVSTHITDDVGLVSARFRGLAFRGDPDLGTDQVVPRFQEKTVTLSGTVVDTTLTRYLLPTSDDTKEMVSIVVEATDTDGNLHADTVSLLLGGPAVELANVEDGQSVQAGLNMSVVIRARDPLGITQVRLDVTGAFSTSLIEAITPPVDSIVFDSIVSIPSGITGEIQVVASARNTLDVTGSDGPVTLNVVSGGAGDTIAPRLRHLASAPDRMELQDNVTLTVTGADDSQGSGVATVGYTVLGISPSRNDTLVRSGSVNYSPPRTGTVSNTFTFPAFNVDSLALPDTLIFEITSWMLDAAGNCGAANGADSLMAFPCTTAFGGERFALNRSGERLTRSVVAGRTVTLPSGGVILDAVVDTVRRNLLLSNVNEDRIEVFRLQQETFLTAIPVGSEPWGLTLNTCAPLSPKPGCGDTLIVGNSGGTNLSNVYLGPPDGQGPAYEDSGRRLLTPDVVLFDVERVVDDAGFIRHSIEPHPDPERLNFADRPQYVARDSTGRLVYSTRVVPDDVLEQVGTIRKVVARAGYVAPEVKIFVEHAELDEANDWIAVAHVDAIGVCPSCFNGNDQLGIWDHIPGNPNAVINTGPQAQGDALQIIEGLGSDIISGVGRWNIFNLGFSDTTYVSSSGDGGWVVFGEGALEPIGRIMMYNAAADDISNYIEVWDRITNDGESVRGVGLNYDGTLGVARGRNAYFFTTDLRLQGVADIEVSGGAGAVMHPLHADAQSLINVGGEYRPDTHIAFVGTGERTVDIYDTFHFFRSGRIFLRDVVNGPLRASLPFPEDNLDPAGAPFQCATQVVTDQTGRAIGEAIEIFQGGDFDNPWPVDGGAGGSEDRCVVLKLYGTTTAGGVVVVDVRKSDILREHPSRQ